MEDYRGVVGDAEVEMNYIEDQLNHVIMSLEVPTDTQILSKDIAFFDQSLERIYVKIPEDIKARFVIDKVAKQVAKEGYGYEEEIKRIVLKKKRLDCDVLLSIFS